MGQIIREAFAQWLRAQLRSGNWMVSDFAEQVGVRPSAVYRWTAGQRTPTDGQIDKIAATLNVSSDVIWTELARAGIGPTPQPSTPRPPRPAPPPRTEPSTPPEERPFAKWMRAQLEERGWTAGFLARKIGLDVVTVRAWMTGLRTPASVQFKGIAEAFELQPEQVGELARAPQG